MSQFEISVIIPTYNRANTLKNCLEILLNQDYPKEKFEIIVVDDGSRDDTKAVIDSLKDRANIRYLKHERNLGISASRNSGIKNAKGGIIAFIDDDCIAGSNWLSSIAAAHKRYPDEYVIQGEVRSLEKTKSIVQLSVTLIRDEISQYRGYAATDGSGKVYSNFIGTGNLSLKSSLFSKFSVFFDENFRVLEDRDFYLQLKAKNIKILYVPEISLAHYDRCTIIPYLKQLYDYGIGRALLGEKWNNEVGVIHYPNLNSKEMTDKLIKKYGIVKTMLLKVIFFLKDRAYRLGMMAGKNKIKHKKWA